MKDSTAGIPGAVGGPDEHPLPAGAPHWLPVLALRAEVTEAAYADLRSTFGEEAAMGWPELRNWLTTTGVAEPVPDSEPMSLVVTPHWQAILSSALDGLLDERGFREKLVGSATRALPPLLDLASWARSAGRWDVLTEIWVDHARRAADAPPEVVGVFAGLPTDARKRYPTLSWACAVAEAHAAPPGGAAAAFFNRMIRDSATLHHDWSLRDNTDSAVVAGILRMIGERLLPVGLTARRRLADQDRDRQLHRPAVPQGSCARAARPFLPGDVRTPRARLRRPARGCGRGHWGGILADDPSVTELAAAIEALAHSLAGETLDPLRADQGGGRLLDSFLFGSLGQMAAIMTTFARGRQALQALDRSGVGTCLTTITREMAGVAGVSASLIGLRAMHAAIWGDARLGLSEMMAALARQPMGARAQDEPLGSLMLGGARSFLLCAAGLPRRRSLQEGQSIS